MLMIQDYAGADGTVLRAGKLVNPRAGESALLFIPGLGGSVKGALDFLEALLPHFGTIYGPDLRGFGLNPLETPLRSPAIIPDDLEAFHQANGLDQHPDLTLCGLSLGGVLATLLATRHPERYRRIILLAPAFKPHGRSFTRRYIFKNVMGRLLRGPGYQTTLPYGLEALTCNPAILNDPQYYDNPPLCLTAGFMLGVRDLCNRAMRDVGKLRIPTMVCVPGQDIVCDPDAMRRAYTRIPAGTPKVCREYPHLYHDVLFEADHSLIVRDIAGWMGASEPAAPIHV